MRYIPLLLTAIVTALAAGAHGQNLIQNPGFEQATLSPWSWGKSDGADATGALDTTAKHGGGQSLRMTNRLPKTPHIFGALWQRAPVEGGKVYRLTAWVKGKAVTDCWIGGGKGWTQRKPLPAGDYHWQQVSVNLKTAPDEKELEIRIHTDGKTEGLWIDDVELLPADAAPTTQAYDPTLSEGLAPSARLYPAPANGTLGPPLRVRSADDDAFGADVRIGAGDDGLTLDLGVRDATPGPAAGGEGMWQLDCVQIAIDTDPTTSKPGYGGTSFELGFALLSTGEVARHAWHSGGGPFDFDPVQATGTREEAGYRLKIRIPWGSLGAAKPPDVIGLNIVVGDGAGPGGGRRVVEWTPGVAKVKAPDEFGRVIRVAAGSGSVAALRLDRPTYEREQTIHGSFAEYALTDLPAAPLALAVVDAQGTKHQWATVPLPAAPAGSTRQFAFIAPAGSVGEGPAKLVATVGDQAALASASFSRIDLATRIPAELTALEARLAALRQRLSAQPAQAGDAYVQAGEAIADRFLRRVRSGGPGGKQTPQWSWLQLEEVRQVLDWTDQRLARLDGGAAVYAGDRPAPGPITLRDGVWMGTDPSGQPRPYYFAGFGHFAQLLVDMPLLPKLGATLIQQERGPRSIEADLSLNPKVRDDVANIFKTSAASGIRVDFLLSPHYFPQWAMDRYPDLPLAGAGFVKYNLFHPEARRVMETWLRAIVPLIKDEPALLSLCLSNEPNYRASGRDAHSRPAWIEFLRQRHGTVEALNALYGTTHARLDDVPVPEAIMPAEVGAQRAYFDWVIFNQQHHAGWHAWANGIVKEIAPNVPTHAKVMARIFDRARISDGTDPEPFADATDLAGNDCWAYPNRGGEYAYNWKLEEAWYDLLHSFRAQTVFNSENHWIPDGSGPEHIAPAHTQAVLWQGALHHQGATTMWIWEEATHPDLEGSIYFRPANLYAAAQAMLDMNRLAPELAAIHRDRPRVALLYSVPSIFWEDDAGQRAIDVHAALNLLGLPVTFISEKQLAEGRRSPVNADVKWIILPHATHVPQAAVDALERFAGDGGKVIRVGADCLAFDEYHRRRQLPDALASSREVESPRADAALAAVLRDVLPPEGLALPELMSATRGGPAHGVEFRIVRDGPRQLVPMINLLHQAQTVRWPLAGAATDLLSGEPVSLEAIGLDPMRPRLLRIDAPPQGARR